MTLFFSAKFVSAGLIAAFLLITPAWAQMVSGEPPLSEEGTGLVLAALGQRLSMPAPDWLAPEQLNSGDLRPLVETIYRFDESQASLEIMPKGEIEALWNTLYGSRIMVGVDRPLADIRQEVIARYARTCKPQLTAFFQLGQDQGDVLAPLGFVCGGYRNTIAGFADKGEVMVMSFKKSDTGTAMVFQEWRGGAFDPATPSSWPVATDIVETRARQLHEQTMLTSSVD